MIGKTLGHYEVLAKLGEGGMGEVYRARDTKLDRDVALKVIPELFTADPERLARFRREAHVLASLNHPNIAALYGLEDSGPTHALVMELVDGLTLEEIIAKGHRHPEAESVGSRLRDSTRASGRGGGAPRSLRIDDALSIARQIAAALDAAHEQGIVHRDLKPANVKVRDDGVVKVLDFGLAKALAADSSGATADVANSPTLTARATQLGVILGTAAYMAPEQAKGRPVDKRADIWSFGVVLFEMLSGRRAFQGDDVSDVLAAVLRQEIDWAVLPPDTPARVRRLLHRCLERDPKRRLRDIGDALFELEDRGDDSTASAAIALPARPARSWLPWAAAAVVAAASITWALARTPLASPDLAVTRAQFTTGDFAGVLDVSPDGAQVVYTKFVSGAPRLMVQSMNQFEAKPIPGADGAMPVFSPDGKWVAYQTLTSPFEIRKIPITGGSSFDLCTGTFYFGGAWGPDNTIVFSGSNGLLRVSADGGTPQPLTTLDTAKGEQAHVRPQFLPGGHQLLFTVSRTAGPQFAVLDLKTGRSRTLVAGGGHGRYVASGHLTYERTGTLFARPFNLKTLTVTGPEAPVVEGVSTDTPDGGGDYSVSDTGLLVYAMEPGGGHGTTLAWMDRKGTSTPLPGQSRQVWGTGRLSPDGRLVANAIQGDHGSDIWIMDVVRGTPTRLTFDGASQNPIWTPDGRRIVYASIAASTLGLFAVPADGSGKPERLLETRTPAQPDSFTPDGKLLLFDQQPDRLKPRQILVLPVATNGNVGQPRPLHATTSYEADGEASPDGKWIAYTSEDSGTLDVYVQAFPGPGPKVRVSQNGGIEPRWARDGRELYYWVDQSQLMAVPMQNGAPGTPVRLFQTLQGSTFDVTPSHDRFLVELALSPVGSAIATVTNWFEELRQRAPGGQ